MTNPNWRPHTNNSLRSVLLFLDCASPDNVARILFSSSDRHFLLDSRINPTSIWCYSNYQRRRRHQIL